MLKFYILIYLLFVVAFPQEIEKKEIIYPEKIYHINFTDSITYIFNERGLHIFKIREGNVHEFLTALHFETSEGIVSEIKGSQFIIYKPDTLFYYDITNPECPVKVNQWNIQSGLKRITGFGDNYILFFSTSTYLTSVNADSVSFVNLITSLNNPRAANYPYFFLSVNNHLQCYRFLPDNSFYLERIITEEKNFAGVASSGNLLGYSTAYKIYGPWYTRIKIIDISQTDFPVLFDYYYYPYGAWGGVFWMESISNNYIVGWQEYGPDIHRAVLGMTGNVSKKFSIDYQVNL
ncbi:MAG: hypothetical protein KGZ71_09415, partial [Desulfobulbaceae bacterium]|nr:hypothetical protein [Desulfobulbaceae bacterium]